MQASRSGSVTGLTLDGCSTSSAKLGQTRSNNVGEAAFPQERQLLVLADATNKTNNTSKPDSIYVAPHVNPLECAIFPVAVLLIERVLFGRDRQNLTPFDFTNLQCTSNTPLIASEANGKLKYDSHHSLMTGFLGQHELQNRVYATTHCLRAMAAQHQVQANNRSDDINVFTKTMKNTQTEAYRTQPGPDLIAAAGGAVNSKNYNPIHMQIADSHPREIEELLIKIAPHLAEQHQQAVSRLGDRNTKKAKLHAGGAFSAYGVTSAMRFMIKVTLCALVSRPRTGAARNLHVTSPPMYKLGHPIFESQEWAAVFAEPAFKILLDATRALENRLVGAAQAGAAQEHWASHRTLQLGPLPEVPPPHPHPQAQTDDGGGVGAGHVASPSTFVELHGDGLLPVVRPLIAEKKTASELYWIWHRPGGWRAACRRAEEVKEQWKTLRTKEKRAGSGLFPTGYDSSRLFLNLYNPGYRTARGDWYELRVIFFEIDRLVVEAVDSGVHSAEAYEQAFRSLDGAYRGLDRNWRAVAKKLRAAEKERAAGALDEAASHEAAAGEMPFSP